MTDVSKAIYSGDWELYPRDGRVEIQDFEYCKIVLTDADALHVWRVLNCWVERNASAEGGKSLLIELLQGHSQKLRSYHGLTAESYNEIVNEYKSNFLAGKYKKLDHIVDFDGYPDRIVVELLPEAE